MQWICECSNCYVKSMHLFNYYILTFCNLSATQLLLKVLKLFVLHASILTKTILIQNNTYFHLKHECCYCDWCSLEYNTLYHLLVEGLNLWVLYSFWWEVDLCSNLGCLLKDVSECVLRPATLKVVLSWHPQTLDSFDFAWRCHHTFGYFFLSGSLLWN